MSIVRVPFSLTGGGAAGYVPAGAILLDGTADYLSWTPSSAGNRRTMTFSWWQKLSNVSSGWHQVFGVPASTSYIGFYHTVGYLSITDTSGALLFFVSNPYFRDPTAWQHWCVSIDTTTQTVTVEVNGVPLTSWSSSTVALNHETGYGNNTQQIIGAQTTGFGFFDGYLSEVIFIDGTVYSATDFGEYDTNNNWIPKDPTGLTFGTNGFWLDFADSADLGKDVSGNGNDFTPTSMSPDNATPDRPADDAANDLGNYATGNPLVVLTPSGSLSNANLVFQPTSNSIACGTIAIPGDSAFKFQATWTAVTGTGNARGIGFRGVSNLYTEYRYWNAASAPSFALDYSGQVFVDGVGGSTFTGFTSGDVVTLAYKNGSLWAAINGTWMNSGNPDAGTGAIITGLDTSMLWVPFVLQDYGASQNGKWTFNFQSVTGNNADTFELFNTANLPAPTVTDPSSYFSILTYAGNSSSRALDAGFAADFAWLKARSHAFNNVIFDRVRVGGGLFTNSTAAEDTGFGSTWSATGVTVGAWNETNISGVDYVGWFLKAGGAGSANEDGDIPSTVSVADHGGFSIVTYTGNGSNDQSIGHGMGQAPHLSLTKSRSGSTQYWIASYYPNSTAGYLNGTHAFTGAAFTANQQAATPTVLKTAAAAAGDTNRTSDTYVAYCFARTPGLIGIGSYVGNGSTDGPYVVVDDGASGFRPAFLMIKCSSASPTNWNILDAARDTYNPMDKGLRANEAIAEFTGQTMDFTANGFKLRLSGSDYNTNSATYIYLAFAEYPFGGDGVAQAKAR